MNLTELRKKYAELKRDFDAIKETAEMKEVRAKHDELLELKERIEILQNERNLELGDVPVDKPEVRNDKPKELEVRDMDLEELDKAYERTFVKAFRKETLTERDLEIYDRVVELRDVPSATPYFQSDVGENGGFLVPHSVSTMINEYKRELDFDLTTLVDVQVTSVYSGEFVYEKLGTIAPWENVSQWENIKEVAIPEFEKKEYKIQDYAGILPIPRTLLQDTDQNLLAYVARYIARKTLVTRNKAILDALNETFTAKKAIANVDDIKDAVDLELDPAFVGSTVFVTNKFGYNFLRKLKDNDGNYLMQPDVTAPDKYMIDGKRVEVVSDNVLPNNGDKAPLFIGDFKEAIHFFDRNVYEVTPTTIGGDAFKRNSYDIRVIDRFAVVAKDDKALVAGEIDTAGTPGE